MTRHTHLAPPAWLKLFNANLHDPAALIAALDELIHSHPAHLFTTNHLGQTSLHYAVRVADPLVVSYLIARGAPINAVDRMGNTPLHYAVRDPIDARNVILLLAVSPRIDIKNKCSKRAWP